jgi:3-deoxy-D-manno-octulosonate 8-phosphate phosphatase KdsC-like HAD superfamily phosphatase
MGTGAIPLAEAEEALARLDPAVLFSDVDGTLVGRDGSLFADLDGNLTLAAAEALVAASAAGLDVVLVSGRNETQLREATRLLGLRDAIGELGAVLLLGRETELLWGEAPRGLGATPREALERSGALALALAAFAGRLEPHDPWNHGRVGTALLRGRVDPAAVEAALAAAGLGWARLLDNGRLRGSYPHLAGDGPAHAYHLLPAGVSKAATAAAYLRRRGLRAEQAAAIGDSPADLELAGVVGAAFLVRNGAWAAAHDAPRPLALEGEHPRRAAAGATPAAGPGAGTPVIVTPSSAGQGFAEAVRALLERRQRRLPG